jgi:hypothetical protein
MLTASLHTYWPLYLLILPAVAVVILLWVLAIKRQARHSGDFRNALHRRAEEERLRSRYDVLQRETVLADPPADAVLGIGVYIQRYLDAQPDLYASYAALPETARRLYALSILFDEGREQVSSFFEKNGKPLVTDALTAVHAYAPVAFAQTFTQLFDAFDADNENASLLPADVRVWNAALREIGLGVCAENAKQAALHALDALDALRP